MSEQQGASNNSGLKALSVIVTILAVIGGMAAIVRPMQNQINDFGSRMIRIENRIENQIKALDEKLQIEVKQVEYNSIMRAEQDRADIAHLRKWQQHHDEIYPPKWLTDDVKTIEGWVVKHNESEIAKRENDARQDEAIKRLDKQLIEMTKESRINRLQQSNERKIQALEKKE